MKKLIFIGGPMGIGKTTVSKELANRLTQSVFLDGDWCWDLHPFVVNEENKEMVIKNITFLLGSFLRNSTIETVIFCWVMHEQAIINELLDGLDEPFEFHSFSLISNEQALTERFMKDAAQGKRAVENLTNSLSRLPLYQQLDTTCIDVSAHSVQETTDILMQQLST